ncbi:MAG: sugar isomerase [Thermoguttaceae bacterium]|jgi:glucosamine--fructose-6-phosphate aminotransferase (isomerizing)|nr:sugar isomerase [Thermoguttaceae bacterium]
MNLTSDKYNKYALVKEMLEAADVVAKFDFSQTKDVADMIKAKKRVFLTGEGSSRIFPAKSFIYSVMKQGLDVIAATEGSFQAAEYDLSSWVVGGASNSGNTNEIIRLLKGLGEAGNKDVFGVTATPGSKIFDVTAKTFLLSCGKENAVAATKSVLEQALVYRSIICNLGACQCAALQSEAAGMMTEIMEEEYDAELIKKLADAPMIYFAGRNNGVAEELTLKTNEITRKKSDYLEGTYLLHGIEEVMYEGEACILIDPFPSECEKIKKLIEENAGLTVVAVASEDTIFPTIKLPQLPGYKPFFQLVAGWNLLVQIGVALGIDLDKPKRARKIGNLYEG